MIHKVSASLKGLQELGKHTRLDGFFSIGGHLLSDSEVRKLIVYGISKGYETNEDIPVEEAMKVLEWGLKDKEILI